MYKILQFTTYDLVDLNHGGKLRSWAIRTQLLKKFNVETMSILWDEKESINGFTIKVSSKYLRDDLKNGLLGDIAYQSYFSKRKKFISQIGGVVQKYKPDIVLLEQPYLWPLIKVFLNQRFLRKKTKIIYSSHNIEFQMKKNIYKKESFLNANQYLTIISKIENEVINRANLIFAASKEEAEYLALRKNLGVKVIVFPNGTTPVTKKIYSNAKYFEHCNSNEHIKWLFVGSWHSPNINGMKIILESLRKVLPKNTKIRINIAGGVGLALSNYLNLEKDYKFVNVLGVLEEADLQQVIKKTDGIILPIWDGGGSNLKTAEALVSKKCIIATLFSFRGYEDYVQSNGVFFASTGQDFAEKIKSTKPNKFYARNTIDSLYWENILVQLPRETLKLFRGR